MDLAAATEFANAFGAGNQAYTDQLLQRTLGTGPTQTPTRPTSQPAPTTAQPAPTSTATHLPGKLPAEMLAAFGLDNPHYLNALAAEAAAGIPYVAPTVYPGAPAAPGYTPPATQPGGLPGGGGSGGLTMSAAPYAAMLSPQPMRGPANGRTPTSDIYAAMQQARAPGGYQNYLNTFQNILNAPRSVIPQMAVAPTPAPTPVSNLQNPQQSTNPNYISPTGPNSGTDWASLYGG